MQYEAACEMIKCEKTPDEEIALDKFVSVILKFKLFFNFSRIEPQYFYKLCPCK